MLNNHFELGHALWTSDRFMFEVLREIFEISKIDPTALFLAPRIWRTFNPLMYPPGAILRNPAHKTAWELVVLLCSGVIPSLGLLRSKVHLPNFLCDPLHFSIAYKNTVGSIF